MGQVPVLTVINPLNTDNV